MRTNNQYILTEVKTGVALIASRSGADVLPVCIKTKANKAKMFRKTYIIIGKPIKNAELGFDHEKGSAGFSRVSERIFDEICKLYEETDIEDAGK